MKHFATFVIIVLLSSGALAQEEYNRPYTNGSNLRLGEEEEYLVPPAPKFIHEGRIPDRRPPPRRRRRRHEVNQVINKIHHILDLVTEFVNTAH